MFTINKKVFKPKSFRRDILGVEKKVPTLGGKYLPYINFDNAASTPALQPVVEEMQDFLQWYSGVHRGTGYKSLLSSQFYDDSHETIANFVGADLDSQCVIMVKNTTEAINKLSYRMSFARGDVVISSMMEHHSNDLPWRNKARVKYIRVDQQGLLDLGDLEKLLQLHYPRVRLVTICGASNVTGHINPIHRIAEMAHAYRAEILVDGAQLLAHHPVNMIKEGDPRHIDYLAFSGHKIYAPFGSGVLIGPRKTFLQGEPEYSGGGTVDLVSRNQVWWTGLPEREEAGSPNVIGAFTLARSLQYLQKIGIEKLALYEEELLLYARERLQKLPGIKIYGSFPRLAVISFNIKGLEHALLGSILCFEAGIGVRTGCFCAQGYVRNLLGIDAESISGIYEGKEPALLPGMLRISLAAYNTREEIDRLLQGLERIIAQQTDFKKNYHFSPSVGAYIPRQWPRQAKTRWPFILPGWS